jgi:hypothetical protein
VDLLIDSSAMPPGWIEVTRHKQEEGETYLRTDDSARVGFEADGYSINRPTQQLVYRYTDSATAKRVYERLVTMIGKPPSEWMYQSPIADQFQFACYDYEGREPYPICTWAARYEEYIVEVHSWLITGRMSLHNLENVIRAVDTRMAQYLGNLDPIVTKFPASAP